VTIQDMVTQWNHRFDRRGGYKSMRT